MKLSLILALSLLTFSAFADHHEEGAGKFEDVKAKTLEGIEKRISHLNEAKSCVSSAADKEALKACRQKMKEHRKEMKENRKAKKEERKSKK